MKISVVIPTYNRAALIGKTLQSVLAQTRLPDEIIIADDGSTDDTAAVVAAYAPHARFVSRRGGSAALARALGSEYAEGDAWLFLDSDDLLCPRALETLVRALDSRPQAALAYCASQTVDEDGVVTEELWQVGNETESDLLWEALARQNFIRSPGCVLLRRAAFEQVGGWDTDIWGVEDWDLWLKLAEPTGARFVRVAEPLFQYRIHGAGLSQNRERMYDAMRDMYRRHQARYPLDHPRSRLLTDLLIRFPERTPPPNENVPVPDSATRTIPPIAALSARHRFLRVFLERSGVARAYRRLPYRMRIGLRRVFGVDVSA